MARNWGPESYSDKSTKSRCGNSGLKSGSPMARNKWNRHTILAALHERGMTLTKLAEINGISRHSLCHVWKRPNARAEEAIARFLGVPVEVLWENFGRYPKRTATILSSKYEASDASQNALRDAA